MTSDDKILRAYLQEAHNRGGGYQMAMYMMISRLMVLEDKLERAGVPFDPDSILTKHAKDFS